jgi:hypothetical protein
MNSTATPAWAAWALKVLSALSDNKAFCTPLPQKPSTPWQPLLMTSSRSAFCGPSKATSMASSSPSRPRSGCTWLRTWSCCASQAARNLARASA